MRKTTQLLIYSIVLIGLAVIDVLTLMMDFRAGLWEMLLQADPTLQDAVSIVLYVMVGFSVLSILIGFYLGGKGLLEVRSPSGDRLHIVLARVIGTINLLLAAFFALSLLDSTDLAHDLETLGLCVIDVILMYSYANVAKAVRNGEV